MRWWGGDLAGQVFWRGSEREVRWEGAGGWCVGYFLGDVSGCAAASGSALGPFRDVASEPSSQ